MNYDAWKSSTDDVDDYRVPCAECGDPCAGIWCDKCLDRWRAKEQQERKAKEASAAAMRETLA